MSERPPKKKPSTCTAVFGVWAVAHVSRFRFGVPENLNKIEIGCLQFSIEVHSACGLMQGFPADIPGSMDYDCCLMVHDGAIRRYKIRTYMIPSLMLRRGSSEYSEEGLIDTGDEEENNWIRCKLRFLPKHAERPRDRKKCSSKDTKFSIED